LNKSDGIGSDVDGCVKLQEWHPFVLFLKPGAMDTFQIRNDVFSLGFEFVTKPLPIIYININAFVNLYCWLFEAMTALTMSSWLLDRVKLRLMKV
jgi:hypothetical protein